MVEKVLSQESAAENQALAEGRMHAALAPSSLLPKDECNLPRLKARFRTLPPARAFLEEGLGPPPAGVGRVSWSLVLQAVETGQWPVNSSKASALKAPSGVDMEAMERRISIHLERVEQRLERMELVLLQLLEHQVVTPSVPPN